MTSMHWACKRGKLNIVQRLFDIGADLEAKDILGRAPLYFAIEGGHEQIVEFLLNNGALVFSFNKNVNYTKMALEVCPRLKAILDHFRKLYVVMRIVNKELG